MTDDELLIGGDDPDDKDMYEDGRALKILRSRNVSENLRKITTKQSEAEIQTDSMNEATYKYQLAVENMNRAEEKAIDEQQYLFVSSASSNKFLKSLSLLQEKLQLSVDQIARLLEQTNDVAYDMEAYAAESLKSLCEIITSAGKCKS